MIQIVGTIRNTVQLAQLDSKWQQRKNTLGKKERNQELTPQERMLQQYQEDLMKMRERDEIASIYNKLKSGAKLSSEEIEYLRRKNPQALKEYEELQLERESYRRQLRNCRSKEEAEQLRINKMNGFLAQAKSIANNPHIPKGEKLAQLEKLMMRLAGIQEEHVSFTKTLQYQELPEEKKDEKTEAEDAVKPSENVIFSEGTQSPEEASFPEKTQQPEESELPEDIQISGEKEAFENALDEIRKYVQTVDPATKKTSVDVSV